MDDKTTDFQALNRTDENMPAVQGCTRPSAGTKWEGRKETSGRERNRGTHNTFTHNAELTHSSTHRLW